MVGSRRKDLVLMNIVTNRKTWYGLCYIWVLDMEKGINCLQSTPPKKLGIRENPKRDMHGLP